MGGSIVLVSGGLDSAVTAAVAVEKGGCSFLHVNYGQRTEARELEAFSAIADFFRVSRTLVADIGYLKEIGGSALTDTSIEVPEGGADTEGIPVTYVPFRNAHLLAIAVSWAEVIGAHEIYIGAVEEDRPGYPDCRREFFDAFERSANLGTRAGAEGGKGGRGIKILTPLIKMNKGKIVRLGVEKKAPFHLTWSCYREEAVACGVCDSCLLRLTGFRDAGVADPIPYKSKAGPLGP